MMYDSLDGIPTERELAESYAERLSKQGYQAEALLIRYLLSRVKASEDLYKNLISRVDDIRLRRIASFNDC